MEKVIPRWEWRTFSPAFAKAEARIRQLGEPLVRTASETYVVSLNSDKNTRIRHGVVGIKRLERTDDHHLERWFPILREELPLRRETLDDVLAAWGLAPIPLDGDSITLERLLDEIVRPHPRLRAVTVEKERHGFRLEGCLAEVVEVTFDGVPFRTLSVESEDEVRLVSTLRDLGLDGLENVSYLTALRRFLGLVGG